MRKIQINTNNKSSLEEVVDISILSQATPINNKGSKQERQYNVFV